MNHVITCLLVGLFATSAAAQEVSIKIVPAENVLTYTFISKSEMKTETKRTINGEERSGGGGGATTSAQKIVFQEGPAGSNWRKFITADATVTRPTRGGEDKTSKIVGAIAGKKIFITKNGKRTVFKAGSEDGEALPRQVTNGIPAKLNLAGLLTAKPLEVQGTYKLKKGFARALRMLLQPVRAKPAAKPTAKGDGEKGGEGGSGRGRRAGARRRGNAGTWNAAVIRILNSKKLTTKGTGQLVSVKETDGKTLAVISINCVIDGNGTPTELGMGAARRRRGGGGGDKKEDTGKASFTMKITGQIVVDQTERHIQSVSLKGEVQSNTESSRTTNRNGEERKIDTVRSTQGSFSVDATCASVTKQQK